MINFLLHSEDSCRWMLGKSRITILSALTARLLSLPESKFSSFFKILKSRWVLETLQADSSCSADTKPECYCLQVSQHCSVAAFICRVLAKPNAAKLLQIPASISGLYLLKGMNAKHSGCEQNGFFFFFVFPQASIQVFVVKNRRVTMNFSFGQIREKKLQPVHHVAPHWHFCLL